MRDVRWTGTALYVKDDDGTAFLVTARHVLRVDEMARLHSFRYRPQGPGESEPSNSWMDEGLSRLEAEQEERWIAPAIFRVPRFTGVARDEQLPYSVGHMLGWLNTGPSAGHAYTYSASELDLAVISLSRARRNRSAEEFLDAMIAEGYEPIPTSLIADGPSGVGADIFTMGFPGTATVGYRSLHPASQVWQSSQMSLPVASWGRVAMDHEALPHFWADMTIYPGNSGGPVVEDGRLVGVVSSQAVVDGVRVPFARVVKTAEVLRLLDVQREKDRRAGEWGAR